jgi:hypothetical protein
MDKLTNFLDESPLLHATLSCCILMRLKIFLEFASAEFIRFSISPTNKIPGVLNSDRMLEMLRKIPSGFVALQHRYSEFSVLVAL